MLVVISDLAEQSIFTSKPILTATIYHNTYRGAH